jgi:hypothetical protein
MADHNFSMCVLQLQVLKYRNRKKDNAVQPNGMRPYTQLFYKLHPDEVLCYMASHLKT